MRVAGPARRTASAFAAVLAALAFAIALPFLLSGNYQLGIAHQVLIFMILAVGYDVLLGFTGLLSFGHIGLFAIGAYTSALLVMSAGAPFLVGLVGAALLTGVIGFLIAIPALRIKGHYLTSADPGARRGHTPRPKEHGERDAWFFGTVRNSAAGNSRILVQTGHAALLPTAVLYGAGRRLRLAVEGIPLRTRHSWRSATPNSGRRSAASTRRP